MNTNAHEKDFSNLMKDLNLTLIKIISMTSKTNDQIAMNELGVDNDLVKAISKLDSDSQKSLSEIGCLVSHIKVNNFALRLAIENLEV